MVAGHDAITLCLPQVEAWTTPQSYKILALMFSRAIRGLDQIQNSSTAQACTFDHNKIDTAKDAIHDVIEELEAKAKTETPLK